MLNCLFYSLFFGLFVNLSFGSLRVSQINRSFMSCFKGVCEASVVTVDNSGNPIYPYFDHLVFTNYTKKFIEQNVGRYTSDYTLDIAFYNDKNSTTQNPYGYPRYVKVKLDSKINYLFSYSKTQQFSIEEKKYE